MIDYDYVVSKSEEYNEENDCAVRAISIAANISYEKAHELCAKHGRKNREGTLMSIIWRVLNELGFDRGSNTSPDKLTVNQLGKLMALDLFKDTYLVYTKDHVFTVRDQKIHDWTVGRKYKVRYIEKVIAKAV